MSRENFILLLIEKGKELQANGINQNYRTSILFQLNITQVHWEKVNVL